MDQLGKYVADAILGIDTLWGGDVKCASGTGRFIADSWFSDEALPRRTRFQRRHAYGNRGELRRRLWTAKRLRSICSRLTFPGR